MWTYPDIYDCIVVGGGHAGVEAAHIAATMQAKTLLLTMNLDTIGKMSCNPSIGGTSKGHIVREIDAMGGLMGKAIDRTGIHFRMLNSSKGAAIWSPRAQADKALYSLEIKKRLEETKNLEIKQGAIEQFVIEDGVIKGVITEDQIHYRAKTVTLCTGTFLRGLIHIGKNQFQAGRSGERPSTLSKALIDHGIKLKRYKTGTPPRIHLDSIDFTKCEEQKGDETTHFSYDEKIPRVEQISCYITYTSAKSKQIVIDNLHLSAMHNGNIESTAVRYCPSIEDKYVRFPDRDRHQIYLEPEGLSTKEVYVNGISSSLPQEVQLELLHSIPGLENAKMMRPGYAIEYDYAIAGQIKTSLETKQIENLFFAGQINGTTGYEEAGGQGLLAGINAALKAQNKPAFALDRSDAYIGVMIDDLAYRDHKEPYRMFTSRAEYRLQLRQDNADLRLREKAFTLGLISDEQLRLLQEKKESIKKALAFCEKEVMEVDGKQITAKKFLARPENRFRDLVAKKEFLQSFSNEVLLEVELQTKYAGYIKRQQLEIDKMKRLEDVAIPEHLDFANMKGLRAEALEKILHFKPATLGQASRIAGVNPADIQVLMIQMKR